VRTTAAELAEVFDQLAAALATLERDDRRRASDIRARLAMTMRDLIDGLEGKTARCEKHPWEKAHNCAACKSERIGRAVGEPPHPSQLKPTPDEVTAHEARRLGESELETPA